MESLPQESKQCTKCGEVKPLGEFWTRNRKASGGGRQVLPRCKLCERAANRKYFESNRDHTRARKRAWNIANADKCLEYEHRRVRVWNTEKNRERGKRYREANREKIRQRARLYDKLHPEKSNARGALRRARIKGAMIGDQKAVRKFYRDMQTLPLVACYYCGKMTKRGKWSRHVDHIIPVSRKGAHAVANLCCACAECNHKKRNKLPHEFNHQYVLL